MRNKGKKKKRMPEIRTMKKGFQKETFFHCPYHKKIRIYRDSFKFPIIYYPFVSSLFLLRRFRTAPPAPTISPTMTPITAPSAV